MTPPTPLAGRDRRSWASLVVGYTLLVACTGCVQPGAVTPQVNSPATNQPGGPVNVGAEGGSKVYTVGPVSIQGGAAVMLALIVTGGMLVAYLIRFGSRKATEAVVAGHRHRVVKKIVAEAHRTGNPV